MTKEKLEDAEYGEIDEFSLFPWNPKETEDKKYERLKNNIEQTGFTEPVKVRDTPLGKEIWDGEDRYKIAKELGMDEIPYVNYGDMSDLEVKVERANTSMKAGSIDTETLYKEFTRCLEDEDMGVVEIADKFGRDVSTVRHGIKAWKEREEGTGQKLDENEKKQISLDSWKDISRLPDDMKEDAAKKKASGKMGSRDLKKTASHLSDEDKEIEQEEETSEDESTETKTETEEEDKTVDTGSKIPEPVTIYVPPKKYKKLEGLTEEDESVGEKALAMVKHCLENDIDP